MAVFGIGVKTSGITSATPSYELAASLVLKIQLHLLELSQVTNTSSTYGFGRSAVPGLAPSFPVNLAEEGDGNGSFSQAYAAVAWGVAPTIPTNFSRRFMTSANIGTGFFIAFPAGMRIPPGASVLIWNIVTTSAIDVNAIISE